jgi:hypothetical protein
MCGVLSINYASARLDLALMDWACGAQEGQKIQSTNNSPPETSSTVPVTYGLVMSKTAACPTSAAVPSRRAGKFARTLARISPTVAAGRTSQKSVSINQGRILLTRSGAISGASD